MKLYHGSSYIVEKPLSNYSRLELDFGQGFYLTSYLQQAEKWAVRKAEKQNGRAYVNEYNLNESKLSPYKIKRFDTENIEWLDLIRDCRTRKGLRPEYDVFIGPIADDDHYKAINMYIRGMWSAERTLEALRYYDINDQWCFATQRVLDESISFVRSWEVTR